MGYQSGPQRGIFIQVPWGSMKKHEKFPCFDPKRVKPSSLRGDRVTCGIFIKAYLTGSHGTFFFSSVALKNG